MHGRAGTGKTTLINSFIAAKAVPVLAPTNKAAAVLRKKGVEASTIHKFLYTPTQPGTKTEIDKIREELGTLEPSDPKYALLLVALREMTRPVFSLKLSPDSLDVPLVVVDESSMVPTKVGEDLHSVVPSIVAFGDPWQLPPVNAKAYFMPPPQALLTQVHRQKHRSGILDMAFELYNTPSRPPRSHEPDAVALPGKTLDKHEYTRILMATDQILVGTHRTRRAINHLLRQRQGYSPLPEKGDTLTCVRSPNLFERDLGLYNGFSYVVKGVRIRADGRMLLTLQDVLDGVRLKIVIDVVRFLRASLPVEQGGSLDDTQAPPVDFDSALTVHKAQGSEWANVVVINEAGAFPSLARKWLYTAVTRAASHVTLISQAPLTPQLTPTYLKEAMQWLS